MYSKPSCTDRSQNGDQSVRQENALSAPQNLCIFFQGDAWFLFAYKVRLCWRTSSHLIHADLCFVVVLLRKQEGRKVMFPSNVTHTLTSYTTPTWEIYIISTFEMLHLKCCVMSKTETWEIFQKKHKKRPSCQCSGATVQVMCARAPVAWFNWVFSMFDGGLQRT